MLSIALRSRWLVASFFVKTIIKLLVFLFAATVLSSTACGIWVAMFWIDMILVKFLRDEHRLKHHELPPFSFNGCVYEPFVNNIRECIALCLASDAISAEWTAEILDEMLPANRYLKFPNIFAPSSVLFVWRLWETIVQFAAQIPFNHYKQDKLVELIVALSKRPTVLVRHRDVSCVSERSLLDEAGMYSFIANACVSRPCCASGTRCRSTTSLLPCTETVSARPINQKRLAGVVKLIEFEIG